MKNSLFLALTFTFAASTAMANDTLNTYVAADASVESALCVVAGEKGYDEAKRLASAQNLKGLDRLSCNGERIKKFAAAIKTSNTPLQQFSVLAKDDTPETRLCVKVAREGLRDLSSVTRRDVKCNGMPLEKFARLYRK